MARREEGTYIHGTEPEEQRRLSMLNSLLNEGSLRAIRLRGGERILDVGSGLGQLSRELARAVGQGGRVVAVERDPEQLEQALRLAGEEELVEFRLGDAIDLPLTPEEWGSFDIAHTRFLLEHVSRPDAVVQAMVRAVRPGGRVILEDDDHDLLRLWPEVPSFDRLWRAYLHAYDQLGNDPYVGRRLVTMLRDAGSEPTRTDMLFFGSCSGSPSFDAFVGNFVGIVEGAQDAILTASSLDADELRNGLEDFKAWGRQPGAALWYTTCWAEGRRPARAGGGGASETPANGDHKPVRARGKTTSMSFLADSAADLNSSLRLEEVFKKIAERVQQLIDCHLFCVMLWNESTGLLEHSYSVRFGEHVEQEGGFPLGQGISGSAAADRKPIRVADVSADPRYIRFRHAEIEIRSELAVPLVVKDRLVGALDLESQQFDAFTEEHEQIVSALASHIATALDNARLYEEVRDQERRLRDDLDTARQIQKGLLPRRPPEVEGLEVGAAFAPARDLSGDFYDFLRYPDGRVAFVVGDVAGKSTGAALYGSLAVGMLRSYVLEHASEPAELLEQMNEQLHALHVERRFVAMSFALYHPGTGHLIVGDAGLPQPYLVREGRTSNVEVSGVPLGGLQEARYDVATVTLEPGDVIVFCSDGLEDCYSAAGGRFAERALPDYLATCGDSPAQVIADELIAISTDYAAGGEAITDDRTVVVLKH